MTVKAGVVGIGKALPNRRVTNQDLVKNGVDTSDEWIRARTGIEARYFTDADTATSDLAIQAGQQALKQSGVSANVIDFVICATSTPDYPLFPSVSCLVQEALGIPSTSGAMDISAACSGFNYALTTAFQYVENRQAKNILVIASDVLSKFINWQDRSSCILFGDGAGAAVISEVDPLLGHENAFLFSNGSYADILMVPDGGARCPLTEESFVDQKHCIFMNGRSVFKVAVNTVVPAVEECLQKIGIGTNEIDLYVFHQANLRILESAREKLEVAEEKMMVTVHKYGNTSASSIPIALADAVDEGRLKRGDRVLLVGFGAGFTWGVNSLKWCF